MKREDIYSSKPAVYMLQEVLREPTHVRQMESWYQSSSDFIVKIGRTRRNPRLRAREQPGQKLLKFWEVDLSVLNQCERELLEAFAEKFICLEFRKDTFYVVSFEKAIELADGIVQKYQKAPNNSLVPTPGTTHHVS